MTLTGDSRAAVPSIALNDENTMPVLGLGVAERSDEETERAVSAALEVGCRLIDTAAAYGNEAAVGRAIAASGIPRAELFVTTKLATADHGFAGSQQGCTASLERLGLDYVDLYLIHWPAPSVGKYVDAFGGLIQSRGNGHARSIGVSNFTEDHLSTVIDLTFVTPAVNQIELHPYFTEQPLRDAHARHGIVTQSWAPIGGVYDRNQNTGIPAKPLENPVIADLASKHAKTPAQIILRWHLDHGFSAIPKSVTPSRIAENFDVFDFALAPHEIAAIDALDTGKRAGSDPGTFDRNSYPITIDD